MRKEAFESIKKKMRELGLDSLLIVKRSNVRYITDFTGEGSYAVIGPVKSTFLTTPLYEEQARTTVKEPFKVQAIKENIIKGFAGFDSSFWGERVGYESEAVTCSVLQKLKNALQDVEFVPTTGIIEGLREIKDSSEINSITRAQHITEHVFDAVLDLVREGVRERELAYEIDYRFRKEGGERSAFETIVASGPNSSLPHAVPSDRKLKAGDIVLFDMGTVIDGYSSDMTRTVVLGEADTEQKKLYSLVLDAQKAAIDSISAGTKCLETYQAALNVFEKAGYGEKFIHSLGHGVGLEVHENPLLSLSSKSILKKNSVVTVEPGVYIPGWGGIRLEDMVRVTENGCVNLTNTPKTLIEL